jgi:hypothetical protein
VPLPGVFVRRAFVSALTAGALCPTPVALLSGSVDALAGSANAVHRSAVSRATVAATRRAVWAVVAVGAVVLIILVFLGDNVASDLDWNDFD